MRSRLFFLGIVVLFIGSCRSGNRVFVEHKALSPKMTWLRTDERSFRIEVDDPEATYDLFVAFRYAEGYPYSFLRVRVSEEMPNGTKSEKQYVLHIKDEEGDYIGEPAFQIWDSEHLVEKGKIFSQKGIYLFTVSHEMTDERIPLAMEIGLILKKRK